MTTHEFAPEQISLPVGAVYVGEDGRSHIVTGTVGPRKPEGKIWPGAVTPDGSVAGGYRLITTQEAAAINGEPYEPVVLSEPVSGIASTEE